jgi:hypothetical protein
MERAEKQRLMAQIRKADLWNEANEYREDVRQRLRREGKGKQDAVDMAWADMAVVFLPRAEEATKPKPVPESPPKPDPQPAEPSYLDQVNTVAKQ